MLPQTCTVVGASPGSATTLSTITYPPMGSLAHALPPSRAAASARRYALRYIVRPPASVSVRRVGAASPTLTVSLWTSRRKWFTFEAINGIAVYPGGDRERVPVAINGPG